MLVSALVRTQSIDRNIRPVGTRGTIASSGYNAFPGLIKDGSLRTLIYRFGSAHNSDQGEIDYRISTDDGATWPGGGTLLAIADSGDDLRDPYILKLASGRWLAGFDVEVPYTPGSSTTVDAFVRYSDDQGDNWSSAYQIPTPYSGPFRMITSSPPIQLPNDDILLPGFGQNGTGTDPIAGLWKSTDDGATFAFLATIASGTHDWQEPQIRRLHNGHIVCLLRSESNHHTWRSVSLDDGSTWSAPVDVNAMTGRPDFVEYRPGRLLQIGRYLTSGDSPTYYAQSRDEGLTWTTPLEVDPGETDLFMYAAMLVTAPGEVDAVYCAESSSSVSGFFTRHISDAT